MAVSPSQNADAFPGLDQIQKETEYILKAKPADPDASLALSSVNDKEVAVALNHGIRANHNGAALSDAISYFFSSDNIALPGLALYFKIDALIERNDANLKATFLNARGQHPTTGPTAGFSSNDFRSKDASDPLAAFATSLALNKVQYEKHSQLFKLATDKGDASGAEFAQKQSTALLYRIGIKSHYVTSLKIAADVKPAIKAIDTAIPHDIDDLAIAAGIEASIPNRLQIGTVVRALIKQTASFDAGRSAEGEFRARAVFAKTI